MGCVCAKNTTGTNDTIDSSKECSSLALEFRRLRLQYITRLFRGWAGNRKKIRKPRSWIHTEAITTAQLNRMREEFWDTQPHYGGTREIWDALRAAAEAELPLAQTIIDSAGIIVQNPDLTVCYDERGARYELPLYVLSEPRNLIRN